MGVVVSFKINQDCDNVRLEFQDTTPEDTGSNNGYGEVVSGLKTSGTINTARANIKVTRFILTDHKTSTEYDFYTGFVPNYVDKITYILFNEISDHSSYTRIEDGRYSLKYEVYADDGSITNANLANGVKYAAYNADPVGTGGATNKVSITIGLNTLHYLQGVSVVYDSSASSVVFGGTAKLAALIDDHTVDFLYTCVCEDCIDDRKIDFTAKCKHDYELLSAINELDTELAAIKSSYDNGETALIDDSLRDVEEICKILKNKCGC